MREGVYRHKETGRLAFVWQWRGTWFARNDIPRRTEVPDFYIVDWNVFLCGYEYEINYNQNERRRGRPNPFKAGRWAWTVGI